MNENNPSPSVHVSTMLTVWRKLRVEVDSMGPVVGNTITGNITNVNPMGGDKYELTTDQDLPDPGDVNRFQNGVLKQNGHDYVVESSGGGANFTVTVVGAPAPVVGPFTSLVDDDFLKSGDVPMPNTSTLAEAMAAAFVTVGFDVDNDEVPFKLHLSDGNEIFNALDWDSRSQNSASYWVAYVLGAFQHSHALDYDPDVGPAQYGSTVEPDGGSAIFLETIRDRAKDPIPQSNQIFGADTFEADVVVHEVGHAVADSTQEPVTGMNAVDPQPSVYVEKYLELIRKSLKPRS